MENTDNEKTNSFDDVQIFSHDLAFDEIEIFSYNLAFDEVQIS